MIISLSQNERLSAIAGSNLSVNCIIIGERVTQNSFTQGANVLSQHRQQVSTITKSSGIIYRGTLTTAVQKILEARDNELITIESIKIINTKAYPISGIKFYVSNGATTVELDAITGSITLSSFSHQELYEINSNSNSSQIVVNTGEINNENYVKIVASTTAAFAKPHGSDWDGTRIFISTREGAASKVVQFPDYNDLTNVSIATGFPNDMDSLVYDAGTNNIYVPIKGTKKIVVMDADDTTMYSIVDVALGGAITFAGSCPILTDGTYLYIASEASVPNAAFIKLLIADLSVIDVVIWTGVVGAHSGVINIADSVAYFASYTDAKLAKLDIAAMTYTEMDLPFAGGTDDMAFIPAADNTFSGTNLVVIQCENRLNGNTGGYVVDVDDMATTFMLDLLPGYGIKYDPSGSRLISLSFDGFIETLSLDILFLYMGGIFTTPTFLTKTFTLRGGIIPNELLITPGGLFVTNWEASCDPSLMKVELVEVVNPVMTKVEFSYRGDVTGSGGGGEGWATPDVIVPDSSTLIAVNDTRYIIAAQTQDLAIDISAITTKVMFINETDDDLYQVTLTGATVYYGGGADVIDGLRGKSTTRIDYLGTKLIRTI